MIKTTAQVKPLVERYGYSPEPTIPLTEIQKEAITRFRERCQASEYTFEDVDCCCGASIEEALLIAKKDRYGLEVDTYLCHRCGILWTTPRLCAASLALFYQNDYRPIYSGSNIPLDDYTNAQVQRGNDIKQYIHLNINMSEKGTVLDIGCGAGATLIPFAQEGFQCYGCDLGAEYLQNIQQKNITLRQGNYQVLREFAPADLIIASHVLEHVTDPISEIQGWGSLLKDGGYIYVEVPGSMSSHEAYGDYLCFLQNAHLYHFNLDALTFLMAKAGFTLVNGDEHIHSIYQKCGQKDISPPSNNSKRILDHFIKRERAYEAMMKRYRRGQLLRKIFGARAIETAKSLLGRK